jgi:hypothetical protein
MKSPRTQERIKVFVLSAVIEHRITLLLPAEATAHRARQLGHATLYDDFGTKLHLSSIATHIDGSSMEFARHDVQPPMHACAMWFVPVWWARCTKLPRTIHATPIWECILSASLTAAGPCCRRSSPSLRNSCFTLTVPKSLALLSTFSFA